MPYGGIKMAEEACTTYGYTPSEKLHEIFTKYHKTHNQAVFDAYTPEMRAGAPQQDRHRSAGHLRPRHALSAIIAVWRCTASII